MNTYEFEEINTNRGKRIEAACLEDAESVLSDSNDYLLMRVFSSNGEVLFDAWNGMIDSERIV